MLQIQLATKSDINFATVSRLENGWLKPTGEQKKKLARALEVKTNWLFPPVPKSKKGKNSDGKTPPGSRR